MFQIRIHGRGGQGVVSAAEMLSVAAFLEGKHAQAVPSFGSERMGAPVVAFCRIDDQPVRLREPVIEPDILIIQDPTLFNAIDVFNGLTDSGHLLINTGKSLEALGIESAVNQLPEGHVCRVPATDIALTHVKKPVPNAVLLGALAAVTGVIGIDAVIEAIETKFPGRIGQANVAAAKVAYRMAHAPHAQEAAHA